MPKILTNQQILYYEVMTSFWVEYLTWQPLQNLAARYYARKVNRKYARYLRAVALTNRLALGAPTLNFLTEVDARTRPTP